MCCVCCCDKCKEKKEIISVYEGGLYKDKIILLWRKYCQNGFKKNEVLMFQLLYINCI